MPTLFILLGFRFSFFSNDHLPIHIHAIKGKIYANPSFTKSRTHRK